MKENQKIFLNVLNSVPGVGYETVKKIDIFFGGDFERGFKGSESEFKGAGIVNSELEALLAGIKKVNPEKEFNKLEKEKIGFICFDEEEFPKLLKEFKGGPLAFYIRGELKKDDDFSFGVVGTRLATNYGKETAYQISFKLAQTGLTIVSGLAYGIDTEAHKGALAAQGRTIAVLGSGIDDKTIFPQQNLKLAHQIIENGALISEYPIGAEPTKEKFPFRNRIISGLSRGILVVEAPLRSGALITAKFALEQNREVFAVPGNISSRMSFGANLLIRQGAALVSRAEDILQELNFKFDVNAALAKNFKPTNEIEEKIFNILDETGDQKHIDEIVRASDFPVQKVNASLTTMEMRGIIKNLGRGQYALEEKYLTSVEDEE